MLKLMGISNVKKIYVESDFYVPVKIRFEHWNAMTEPKHCWGISKLDGNFLFEIAIGEETGELKYITLVASPKVQLGTPPQTIKCSKSKKEGLPRFETKEWNRNDYYTKEMIDFDIYIDKRDIFIVLFNHEITKIIINDRVVFGFDKNDILCSIEVKDISTDEKSGLGDFSVADIFSGCHFRYKLILPREISKANSKTVNKNIAEWEMPMEDIFDKNVTINASINPENKFLKWLNKISNKDSI